VGASPVSSTTSFPLSLHEVALEHWIEWCGRTASKSRVFQERTGHRLGYTLLGIVFGETLRLQFSTWPAVCDRTHRPDILTTPSESDLR
jgi:hypothetical protein